MDMGGSLALIRRQEGTIVQVLVVGIDVAKDTLCVCTQTKGQDRPLDEPLEIANAFKGWSQLTSYLHDLRERLGYHHIEVFLEATGVYADKLCHALANAADLSIHLVPPDRLALYLRALGNRGKTDALDAKGIARFGAHHDWPVWSPHSSVIEQLRHLLQTMEGLKQGQQQARNRLHADERREVCHPAALSTQKQLLKWYDQQLAKLKRAVVTLIRSRTALRDQQALLLSIPGVGPETVLAVLALVGERLPPTKKQLVAYVGLAPRPHESGTSVRGRATTSPSRGRAIRKMLYMGVLQAFRRNPELKAFYDRLIAKGKPAKVALTACMRKQLHIIYGVLKNQESFDLSRLQPA
jgi:transposase